MSKDPIGFSAGDTNLYGYVGTVGKVPRRIETNLYGYSWNDPINYIDPNGMEAENAGSALPQCTSLEQCQRARTITRAIGSGVGFIIGRCGVPQAFAFGLGVRLATSSMCEPTEQQRNSCPTAED